jgi:hypothetical protein
MRPAVLQLLRTMAVGAALLAAVASCSKSEPLGQADGGGTTVTAASAPGPQAAPPPPLPGTPMTPMTPGMASHDGNHPMGPGMEGHERMHDAGMKVSP